jgi:hypothetical protein
MKQKLFRLLPSFITSYKHGDKIAHAIYGTLFYGILTFILVAGVEIYDNKTHRGDMLDFLATVIIPTLIYILI